MKLIQFILVWLIIMLILTLTSIASDFKAKQPFLITAAGQGPDVTMVKILAQKAGLKFTFEKLAKPDHLKNHAALVLVAGSSTKGLGAANIDKDQEYARVEALIKSAKEAKLKIVTIHLGGQSRRGKLSDDFNKIAAKNADCLIILNTGNEDKFFTSIAERKKIPMFTIDKIVAAGDILKKIFSD